MDKVRHSSQRKIIVQIYTMSGVKDDRIRQLPSSPYHPWNQKYTFLINRKAKQCDYFVLLFFMPPIRVKVKVPQKNTLFVYGESIYGRPLSANIPPLHSGYDKFFNTIMNHCTIEDIENTIVFSGSAATWYHNFNYDQLARLHSGNKHKLLSVICSNISGSETYRNRLQFTAILKEHFKDQIDHFGRGIRPIRNKLTGIVPYKYSVVMENNVVNGYWTEKLGDTFAGLSYPFYYGAPDICNYFSHKMLTPIDIKRPYEAVEIIEQGIAANLYEKQLKNLKIAKDMILNRYNLFAVLDQYISEHQRKYPIKEQEKQYVTFNYRPPLLHYLFHLLEKNTGYNHISLGLMAKKILLMFIRQRIASLFLNKVRRLLHI